ncbi:mRNA 3'-end-processing protein rna14 [Paramarasmius palmivorus]|uniref:mRNA 3'-end-processing protein RNA14 n=1 Tax=Paramarasmius palmivorus TaxID=297713 RepID=A0AAW0BIQ7_9AGAR
MPSQSISHEDFLQCDDKDAMDPDAEAVQTTNPDPRDVGTWNRLLSFAKCSSHTGKSIKIYEAALECFPYDPKIQVAYAEKLLSTNSPYTNKEIEDLLRVQLERSPSVELSTVYVAFIRLRRPSSILQAYQYVLDFVAHETESGELWDQYLDELEQVGDHLTLQRALHQVVKIPLEHLSNFWSRLMVFERVHNSASAEETFVRLLPSYSRALLVAQKYQHYMEYLCPMGTSTNATCSQSCLPSSPFSFCGDQTVQDWITYLEWEEGDPLSLKVLGNLQVFTKRLRIAYNKACHALRFHAEICTILNLTYADTLEAMSNYQQAKAALENIICALRSSLYSSEPTFNSTFSKCLGIAYIMYMQFAIRTEGLTSFRSIFDRAKSDTLLVFWLVYEAAAIIEFRYGGGDTSRSINAFESGMLHFGNDSDYIMRYLEWLIHVNEREAALSLLESVANRLPAENASRLWCRWLRSVYMTSDWEYIRKVEGQAQAVFEQLLTHTSLATGITTMPQVFRSVSYPENRPVLIRLPTLESLDLPPQQSETPRPQNEDIQNFRVVARKHKSPVHIKAEPKDMPVPFFAAAGHDHRLPRSISEHRTLDAVPEECLEAPKRSGTKMDREARQTRQKNEHQNSAPSRRTKIATQTPYDHLRTKKIVRKTITGRWYALLTDEILGQPPVLPSHHEGLQDYDLFLHVKATEAKTWEEKPGILEPISFIAVWVWRDNEWIRVKPGYMRMIEGDKYILKINNCYEPVWVTQESWKRELKKCRGII